ncbi:MULTISPECIES: hypothetical protein [Prochlorococcus]|uniref:Uncharacterized protein n=1 Tax=Prochlorococcus marinus str. MIT 9116 TaxID=167544 RepID=A0A0A1ZUA4_PROMR|nr:hypothetical protein [Prochlorococcus marinus]KGF91395.1 hypothetical protein EU92_0585 [Prochlorococcus marinus str. MIT 9107]KGF91743.1 hypothetical protein EU93_0890 [Prochlorococcus marinus str. MIT 9116]
MKAFIKIIILGILCYTSFPVKTHFLEQSEEECKKMKLRVFNCEFKRIRKPNDTYSDFQYKFALSNYKIPSIMDKFKQYPSRYKEGASHTHIYSMIIVKFDDNKIIREKGIISIFPSMHAFKSKNFSFLVGTSCISISYKNKNLDNVCKQDFWNR